MLIKNNPIRFFIGNHRDYFLKNSIPPFTNLPCEVTASPPPSQVPHTPSKGFFYSMGLRIRHPAPIGQNQKIQSDFDAPKFWSIKILKRFSKITNPSQTFFQAVPQASAHSKNFQMEFEIQQNSKHYSSSRNAPSNALSPEPWFLRDAHLIKLQEPSAPDPVWSSLVGRLMFPFQKFWKHGECSDLFSTGEQCPSVWIAFRLWR